MLSPFPGDAGFPRLSIAACSPALPAPVVAMRVPLPIFLLYDSDHESARPLVRLDRNSPGNYPWACLDNCRFL